MYNTTSIVASPLLNKQSTPDEAQDVICPVSGRNLSVLDADGLNMHRALLRYDCENSRLPVGTTAAQFNDALNLKPLSRPKKSAPKLTQSKEITTPKKEPVVLTPSEVNRFVNESLFNQMTLTNPGKMGHQAAEAYCLEAIENFGAKINPKLLKWITSSCAIIKSEKLETALNSLK